MANPKTEALAFRIWAYASPLGWDCTVKDIAEEMDEGWQRVSRICALKGWTSRLRHDAVTGADYLAVIGVGHAQKHKFTSYADATKYSERLL